MVIPKRLHAVWVGGEMPQQHREFLAGWKALHPSWEFHLWTETEIEQLGLQNQELYDNASHHAPGSEGQFRSDVARYEILDRFGGVYIDTDMECLAPIEGFLVAGGGAFAGWEAEDRWVNNAVLGAVAGHPLIRAVIDGLAANVRAKQGPGIRPNVLTGPQYLTAVYRTMPETLTVLPRVIFYPYLWNQLEHRMAGVRGQAAYPYSYAVHHWQNMRNKRGVPLG